MRVRKQRAPLLGFSLALPPPDISDEMQVKRKNELFIDVDDANVSPMITANKQLFPACFFHVNNTNLFVLMNGVSMFTEGRLAHREEPSAVRAVEEEAKRDVAANAVTKSPQPQINAGVDSVEAAIRGIEDGGESGGFSSSGMLNIATSEEVVTSGADCGVYCGKKTSTADARLSKTFLSVGNDASVPKDYVALFANNVDPLPAVLQSKILSDWKSFKVRGFMPGVVKKKRRSVTEPSLTTSMTMKHHPDRTTIMSGAEQNNTSFAASAVSEITKRDVGEKKVKEKVFHSGVNLPCRRLSVKDVGRSNTLLNLDAVVTLSFIGQGTQGTVHRVMLDDKLYALKSIDVKGVTEATNAVERQGRKLGLVKELNMIRVQRLHAPPKNLMQMFNAVATLVGEEQRLYILMELMSLSVEDAQKMVSRIPTKEMMKITQSTFSKHLAESAQVQKQTKKLLERRSGLCVKLTGRSSYNILEEWEKNIDRQTPVPEIILSMLAADVLSGLKELHNEYSIVHCDLKPANVLLDFDMTCFKIADFGCGCQMDKDSFVVRRTGVDLGSKLYKAPERLRNEPTCAEMDDGVSMVEFTAAADVWSLGIMLLELSSGVHPCYSFKSDYWNYVNNLHLSRMVKPLTWSAALYDFISCCIVRDPSSRWTVNKLLEHPFILRYRGVPRAKLRTFMKRLKRESETFQQRRQRELLIEQILLSTGEKSGEKYRTESRLRWKSFTGFLAVAPRFEDHEKFPQLS